MKYIGFIWIYIDFKKSKQKIAPKQQKAQKALSKPSKFCIFIKSLKSVAYAIKTFKSSIALFLKLLKRISVDISYQRMLPRLNPYYLLSYEIFIFIIISHLKNRKFF